MNASREGCCGDWPKPCPYHEGWADAFDSWSWGARQINGCDRGTVHGILGIHIVVRCTCGAGFMSTDGSIALGMAESHGLAAVS